MSIRSIFTCIIGLILLQAYPTIAQAPIVVAFLVQDDDPVPKKLIDEFLEADIRSFAVLNTATTSDTAHRLLGYLAQKGIAHVASAWEPYVDAATMRNKLVQFTRAAFPQTPFIIMPDLIWRLKNGKELAAFCAQAQQTASSYMIRLVSDAHTVDYVPRLIATTNPVSFVGVADEIPVANNLQRAPDSFFFDHSTVQGGVSRFIKRNKRDLDLLLTSFADNPDDPHTVFAIACVYAKLGNWPEAFVWFQRRSLMCGAAEENYLTFYQLGQLIQKLPAGNGAQAAQDMALVYFTKACDAHPCRAEPLIKIANYYFARGNQELGFLYAKQAAELPYPANDCCSIEQQLYDYERYKLVGVHGWYVGQFQAGEQALRHLHAHYPDDVQVNNNLQFYVERAQKIDPRVPTGFGVDFHTSMELSPKYQRSFVEEDAFWKLIKERYDATVVGITTCPAECRIPKIIHQIWLGSQFPEKYKAFHESWHEHHPDWVIKVWTDKEIAEFGLHNQAAYNATTNYGQKSDIARYEILYRHGGVYVDADIECLHSFELLHHLCDFYAGFESEGGEFKNNKLLIGNALIGSVPGHPILQRCIDDLGKRACDGDTWMRVLTQSGPYHFTECIKLELPTASVTTIIFPSSYFYPWPGYISQRTIPQIKQWVRPETFAVHYWAGAWR